MKNKKILMILATALVFAACGNQNADTTKTEEKATTETTTTETTDNSNDGVKEVENKAATDTANTNPIPATGKTLEEAIDTFYTHFADDAIELSDAELDFDDGKYSYKIQGFKDGNEYELSLNADTLDVLAESKEADDDANKLAIDRTNIITAKEAMEKALEGQDGAYVKEYELSIENGKAEYDIDVENGNDVKIDASTGELIK